MKQKYSLGQIDGKQKDSKQDSADKLGEHLFKLNVSFLEI